jgi:hypothetical protein
MRWLLFIGTYSIFTFLLVPFVAPIFGREKVVHLDHLQPATYGTLLLNRNYVTPELNKLLVATTEIVAVHNISISYLDANFPFFNGFPLLPHLSHNDGKKIDLSFIYETPKGELTHRRKSVSGYGVFEPPTAQETNQINSCERNGHMHYSLARYLTFGSINDSLQFSESGTRYLLQALLKQPTLGKIFIEPHLKERLNLRSAKVRFHGCHSVRHDDHVHVQL